MNKNALRIIEALNSKRNPPKALWFEQYVKHDSKSLGVSTPEIREIIRKFEKQTQFTKEPIRTQARFLNDLMRQEYAEPKLAAIIFIQLYWKSEDAEAILAITAHWFDKDWITDWNVCDWLCVRLLTPLLENEPELPVSQFRMWNRSRNPWKARASLVPFAQNKYIADHRKTILKFSTELIKRQERFCKTAVGWVLREYSKVDTEFVTDFLEQYKDWTTTEVITNATKYTRRKKGLKS